MKTLTLLFFCFLSSPLFSQVDWGIKSGVGISTIYKPKGSHLAHDFKYLSAFEVSGYVRGSIYREKLHLKIVPGISLLGTRFGSDRTIEPVTYQNIRLYNIKLPVYLEYSFTEWIRVHAGAVYLYRLSDTFLVAWKHDLMVSAGASVKLVDKLFLVISGQSSLTLNKETFTSTPFLLQRYFMAGLQFRLSK